MSSNLLSAAVYHPDKAASPDGHANAEAFFVKLKSAQDTLTDATKRFAYERFGPNVLQWQHVSSMRDYITVGLQTVAPLYAGLALFEYHTITRPYWSPILTKLLNPFLTTFTTHPPLLPFQLLTLAHKATLTFFIALGQLSPLMGSQDQPIAVASSSAIDEQQLQRLEQLIQTTEIETGRLLALEMAPLAGDEAGQNDMRGRLREWLVQNTIRADPEVRDAVGKAMQRRRVGAPAGAR
ncbi:MAG: hypothetical protein Q9222_003677 [Ikaeria aurantiellina]